MKRSKQKYFQTLCMNLAKNLAKLSECKRLKVGTVIVSTDYQEIFSWGYNGGAKGGTKGCRGTKGTCGDLHSEINALLRCRSTKDKNVFVTTFPCELCCKALVNFGGVKSVFYNTKYRNNLGQQVLNEARIKYKQISQID